MKKLLTLFTAITILSCNNPSNDPVEAAQESNEKKEDSGIAKKDAEFITEAASGGMMEVELGNAAQTKASSEQVKSFGSMMVRDHTKANDELKSVAAARNITIPTAMGEDEQKMVNNLMEKSGADFDKDYMSMMVDDHKKDIDKFEDAAENAQDAEVKAFALRTLPVLKTHLDSATVINDDIRKNNK
jgi:putative membrane protein